jgi:hypothetical protein
MKIAIDLDNTLGDGGPIFNAFEANPREKIVLIMKLLHELGHQVIVYTARPWNQYDLTKVWLDEWGIKYDILICGKFPYDAMLCDRSTDKLSELMNRVMKDAEKKNRSRDSIQG